VYSGAHVITGEKVAIKLEPVAAPHPQLNYESKLYRILGGARGIPQLKWHGVEGTYNVMIIDMLGPSLEDVF